MGADGARALVTALPRVPQLTELDLGGTLPCHVADDGCVADNRPRCHVWGGCGVNAAYCVMDRVDNGIGADGIWKLVGEFPPLPQLTKLGLAGTQRVLDGDNASVRHCRRPVRW